MRREYPESMVGMILEGRAVPKAGRILCKAITEFETDSLAAKVAHARGVSLEEAAAGMGLDLSAADPTKHVREAPYHEVVACDPKVTEEDPDIRPGALVKFVTAAADFAKDKRYVFVKAGHIIACERGAPEA